MLAVKRTPEELVDTPLVRTLNLWKSWHWLYHLLIFISSAEFYKQKFLFFFPSKIFNKSACPEWREQLSNLLTTSCHRSWECWGKLGPNSAVPDLMLSSTWEGVMCTLLMGPSSVHTHPSPGHCLHCIAVSGCWYLHPGVDLAAQRCLWSNAKFFIPGLYRPCSEPGEPLQNPAPSPGPRGDEWKDSPKEEVSAGPKLFFMFGQLALLQWGLVPEWDFG